MKQSPQELLQKYQDDPNGRDLLKKFSLDTIATWKVDGASTENGGGRTIGYFHGTLRDVMAYAVVQTDFWYYSGGYITKLDVKHIDSKSVEKELALRQRREELVAQLAEIDAQLPK